MKLNSLTAVICLALFAAPIIYGQAGEPTVPSPSASALKVTCKGDQITIAANDSTLASILAELRKCSGTAIDVPGGAGDIRFFDTIGPAPIREVLVSLFSATGLNYVIGSAETDPEKIQKVVLTARGDTTTTEAAGDRALTPSRRAYLQILQNNRTEMSQGRGDSSAAGTDSENREREQSPPPQPENPIANSNQEQPADQSAAPAAAATPTTPSAPPPPTPSTVQDSGQPKTIDNQITNMQQLFEQRRQMIQNSSQNPSSHAQ